MVDRLLKAFEAIRNAPLTADEDTSSKRKERLAACRNSVFLCSKSAPLLSAWTCCVTTDADVILCQLRVDAVHTAVAPTVSLMT